MRNRIYRILESGNQGDRLAKIFSWSMIVLIVLNSAVVVLETVAILETRFGHIFLIIETCSVAIFSVEYIGRLWTAVEHLPLRRHGPLGSRLRYMIGGFAIIDLLAIVPFYVTLFLPNADLSFLLILRLLRLLKIARYSPALGSLGRVISQERRSLGAGFFVMILFLMISATGMYYAEHHVQPEAFASIPDSMWWGIATLTTVGYGDVIPISPVGKILGGIMMLIGLAVFAIPIGIIASGFSTEIRRQEFVVSWGIVSRVPLFSELNAESVSRITQLLRSRVVPQGDIIAREGDSAAEMYFIASGEVEVEVRPDPVILSEGDFFGELALLQQGRRNATIRALSQTSLLVLGVDDFRMLMEDDKRLSETIKRVAQQRT